MFAHGPSVVQTHPKKGDAPACGKFVFILPHADTPVPQYSYQVQFVWVCTAGSVQSQRVTPSTNKTTYIGSGGKRSETPLTPIWLAGWRGRREKLCSGIAFHRSQRLTTHDTCIKSSRSHKPSNEDGSIPLKNNDADTPPRRPRARRACIFGSNPVFPSIRSLPHQPMFRKAGCYHGGLLPLTPILRLQRREEAGGAWLSGPPALAGVQHRILRFRHKYGDI